MGFLRDLLRLDAPAVVAAVAENHRATLVHRFNTIIDPGTLYGVQSFDDVLYRTGRVTRAELLRVPAVKRARDLICSTIGQFPLAVFDAAGKPATSFTPNLLTAGEPGVPSSITWTRVVEDMFFFERAWLREHTTAWHGRVAEFRRLDAETVNIKPKIVQYKEGSAQVWPDRPGLIRIDSPNTGIADCSPAVRACIALERIAFNHLNGAPPIDYFTPKDNVDPFDDDDDASEFLDSWAEARRTRSTAYIPAELEYKVEGWDPEKLQLSDARQFAVLEVARLTGIDPEELGVSTTSRTYFNAQDRRRSRTEDVLGPYMTAIESRLSMDDITPHGYTVRFDPAAYLSLDELSAAQADSTLVAANILRPEEAREKRGLDTATTPQPAEAPAPQEAPAP